jgi:hypothetical protein
MADFNWQASLDAIDADDSDTKAIVPKHAVGLYVKGDDGKFSLDADLAKRLDTKGLTSALDKERKSNRDLNKLVSEYQKHGKPEELAAKLDELQKAAEGKGDQKAADKFEKLRQDMLQAHSKELEAEKGKSTAMRQTVEKYLIDSEANAALSELKGNTKLLLPHIRSSVKVFEENGQYIARVVDSSGEPRGDGKGGYMTVRDLVAEMRKSSDFAPAFAASGTSGSGMRPGTGSGGKPGAENLTPLQKIQRGLDKK